MHHSDQVHRKESQTDTKSNWSPIPKKISISKHPSLRVVVSRTSQSQVVLFVWTKKWQKKRLQSIDIRKVRAQEMQKRFQARWPETKNAIFAVIERQHLVITGIHPSLCRAHKKKECRASKTCHFRPSQWRWPIAQSRKKIIKRHSQSVKRHRQTDESKMKTLCKNQSHNWSTVLLGSSSSVKMHQE